MRPERSLAAGLIAWSALSGDACAHALAQRYDLPLPLGHFLAGAGAAVAVSFVILALFWRRKSNGPAQSDYAILRGNVPTVIVAGCQILAVGALVLIVAAGLFGHPSTFKNLAPVAVWVIWWVGLSFVSAFIGNVWTLIKFMKAGTCVRPDQVLLVAL